VRRRCHAERRPAGAGYVVVGGLHLLGSEALGDATNNVAEYTAVQNALRVAADATTALPDRATASKRVAFPPKRGSNVVCCAARKRGSDRSGLSAPLSAAATSLIGGGKLSFFAPRLFPLAVLAPAPDRLGAASHRDEPNNQLDDLHAATQFLEPDWIARCSTAPSLKCQSPLTLRSSGFDRTTISRLPDRCQP
jgi:hypothetical protein